MVGEASKSNRNRLLPGVKAPSNTDLVELMMASWCVSALDVRALGLVGAPRPFVFVHVSQVRRPDSRQHG